jgi:DNA polymerase/3'-5' exonuclease PolX
LLAGNKVYGESNPTKVGLAKETRNLKGFSAKSEEKIIKQEKECNKMNFSGL